MGTTTPYAWLHPAARAAVVIGCALGLPACEVNLNTEGLTSKETRTFAVTGEPDVTLETFDGAIEIHSWDRTEVEVEIERRAMEQSLIDQMIVEAEQQGDRLVVRVKGPSRAELRGFTIGVNISPQARLRVAVPRRSIVQARTDDGSIRVENIEGRLALRTGDGSVSVERITGDLEIHTGDGSIRVERSAGRLDLETSDGRITASGRPTVVRARTSDGSIRIEAEPDTVMADAWELTTGDGSVTLVLPPAFNAQVDAETSDGVVRSSHPALVIDRDEGDDRRVRRREVRTAMGQGGPLLKIRTGDGSIRFEP
jgi:hypothetical protein